MIRANHITTVVCLSSQNIGHDCFKNSFEHFQLSDKTSITETLLQFYLVGNNMLFNICNIDSLEKCHWRRNASGINKEMLTTMK